MIEYWRSDLVVASGVLSVVRMSSFIKINNLAPAGRRRRLNRLGLLVDPELIGDHLTVSFVTFKLSPVRECF
jgi:hypothetical protein